MGKLSNIFRIPELMQKLGITLRSSSIISSAYARASGSGFARSRSTNACRFQ